MFEVGGTLPVNNELLDFIETDAAYDEFPNNVIRIAAKESRETAVPRPKTPGYLEWETNMNRAFENIKNGTDPKEALDRAASEIDNLLKKYEEAAEKMQISPQTVNVHMKIALKKVREHLQRHAIVYNLISLALLRE